METRKLQLVGARSYSVSLPKDWVVNQGLDKQSTVYIQQTPNHALLIKAQDTKESLHQLTIPLSEIENIQESRNVSARIHVRHTKPSASTLRKSPLHRLSHTAQKHTRLPTP